VTSDVPDPANPGKVIENEALETVPFVIESLEKEDFRAVSVAAGDSVSVAVSDKGEIRAWGSFRVSRNRCNASSLSQGNEGVLGFDGIPGHSPFQFTPIPLPSLQKVKIIEVACGENHVLALTTSGHVYVWGSGQQNQLGRRIMARRQLNGLEPERLGLRNIVHVAAGVYHSFAVDVNGNVWAWGLNTFHQTGLTSDKGGDDDMIIVPAQIEALAPQHHNGAKVVQISGGEHHTLFLFDNGEVWGCGRSDAHQLGIPEDHPAFEGIKERREEVKKQRLAKVDAAKKKLEAMVAKEVDEEDKAAAENEVQAAEIDVNTPQDDYVPEPVRVSELDGRAHHRSPSLLFRNLTRSCRNILPGASRNPRKTLSRISPLGLDTILPFPAPGTCIHGVLVVSETKGVADNLESYQLGLGDDEEAEVPTLVRSKVSHRLVLTEDSRSNLTGLSLPALAANIAVFLPSSKNSNHVHMYVCERPRK